MRHTGSCHCGAIAFEVEGELAAVIACNCSICSRKGALLWAVPRASLHLSTPEEGIGSYAFNTHRIVHRFCPTCGIHPFAEDAGDAPGCSAYVNIRCLDGIDLAAVPKIEFDGRSVSGPGA